MPHEPPPVVTRNAVILAAGCGRRLKLVGDIPKALVPVHGVPLLQRAIAQLHRYGVQHLVIATGYKSNRLQEALVNPPIRVTFCHNERFAETQNSVSLATCRSFLEGDAFFKLDGDVLFSPQVLDRIDQGKSGLTVAVDESRKLDEEAMKVACEGSRIVAFGKSLPLSQSSGESIGIERIAAEASRPLFAALDAATAQDQSLYYEDVYGQMIASGDLEATAVKVGDLPWTEIDTPEDLEQASRVVEQLAALN